MMGTKKGSDEKGRTERVRKMGEELDVPFFRILLHIHQHSNNIFVFFINMLMVFYGDIIAIKGKIKPILSFCSFGFPLIQFAAK